MGISGNTVHTAERFEGKVKGEFPDITNKNLSKIARVINGHSKAPCDKGSRFSVLEDELDMETSTRELRMRRTAKLTVEGIGPQMMLMWR